MENYFVTYEVNEDYPSYEFIIRAENLEQAKEIAEKEIAESFSEEWLEHKDFYMTTITSDDLIKRLAIN